MFGRKNVVLPRWMQPENYCPRTIILFSVFLTNKNTFYIKTFSTNNKKLKHTDFWFAKHWKQMIFLKYFFAITNKIIFKN